MIERAGDMQPARRLRSLWDMLEINARPFCEAVGLIARIRGVIAANPDNTDGIFANPKSNPFSNILIDSVTTQLTTLKEYLEALNAPTTAISLSRLIGRINAETSSPIIPRAKFIADGIDEVWGRLLVDQI